ncbi:uncharacterized protein LOC116159925 [Photinus pyralis]|uniref:uncharacterized protein LOC116159925 n=1 Tax=Photinus pyralis TaxID=7054 RepID=UPI0012676671|nr:uncharacterized protein LOC116159925 [Photinus pyralis]
MGIAESTLRKRLKSGTVPTSLGRYKTIFSKEEEQELAQQVRDLDKMFYGLTKKGLQIATYKFAVLNNVPNTFNKVKQMAGETWIVGFCQRHNITLRQPEKCSMGRVMGFNKTQVQRFFDNLKELYEKRKYIPERIFNMDETGLSTVPNKLPKVLTTKGKKLVSKVSSGERGQLITAVCCVSASGIYVPPALIFPRKRLKDELYLNAPPGTLKLISDSGFINTDLFYKWIKHFKTATNPTKESPVLLVLDNHSSHRDLQVIHYCKENHIDLLSLPPHASHRLQPLDVGFFGPLKTAYTNECDNWMVSNPGKVITQMQVAGLFNAAYSRVANLLKAQNSFKSAGIYPYNPLQFDDIDFAPSLVTEIPLPQRQDEEAELEINFPGHVTPPPCNSKDNDNPVFNTPPPCCSRDVVPTSEDMPPPCSSRDVLSTSKDMLTDITDLDIVCEDGTLIPSTFTVTESPKNNNTSLVTAVKISDILPLPSIQHEQNRRKSKSQRSEILSSTPFKSELEEIVKQRQAKEDQKKVKQTKRNLSNTKLLTKKKKKATKTTEEKTDCPGCGETFTEPLTEDWIMCSKCSNWWHEACTTYVIGVFTCFACDS